MNYTITPSTLNPEGHACTAYRKMESRRDPFLRRARDCARLTIPALLPPDGHTGSSELYKPFQSIGARGVNSLASKLLLTLLPPSRRFHRLVLSTKLQEQLGEERAVFEQALSRAEEYIDRKIETMGVRITGYEMFRQLIVAGNVLVHLDKRNCRVFPLDQYVVERDTEGTLMRIVVREKVALENLPEQVVADIRARMRAGTDTEDQELYTYVRKEGETWIVSQEVLGVEFNRSSYGSGDCPWIALRWTRIDGEDYGRGHCEEYIGDLIASESLSRSIIRLAAVAAKVLFLRSPAAMTSAEAIEEAEEGAIIDGVEGDITVISSEKSLDFQIAKSTLDDINTRLAYAFLLNSAVRRNGERVTAEEIRYMAGELEDALGGVYSVLSREFQLQLVRVAMRQLQRDDDFPALPEKSVEPTIITGIDALGRSHELARMDAFLGGALQTFGPDVLQFVNVSEYLRRRAVGLDLDITGLVKSDEEIAAAQQQAAQQQMVEKLGGPAIKAMSDQALAPTQGPMSG
jgi:hypothetical protein